MSKEYKYICIYRINIEQSAIPSDWIPFGQQTSKCLWRLPQSFNSELLDAKTEEISEPYFKTQHNTNSMQNGIFVLTAQVCGMGWLATNLVTLSRWTHRVDGLDIILLNQSRVPTSQCIFYLVSGSVTRPSKIEPNYITYIVWTF